MTTAAFDTLRAARALQEAGFDQQKAETLAGLMRQDDSDYATKADIARLEAATKGDIARLEAATKGDIARLEAATKGDIARLEARLEASINQLRNWFVTGLVTLLVAILATAFLPP